MNKFLKSTLCLLAISTLFTSCSSTNESGIKISYSDVKTFRSIKESESSSKDVYMIMLCSSNDTGANYNVANTDFVLTLDSKEYKALYFVDSHQSSSETFNGSSTTSSYIVSHSTTHTIEPNKESGSTVSTSSFYIAFEVDGTNGKIAYKGSEISLY